MSIGLGILVSTILFIVVWQIDKHGLWQRSARWVIKASAFLVVVGIIGGIVTWLFMIRGEFGSGRSAATRSVTEKPLATAGEPTFRDEIRAGSINTYWGLDLGISQDEVRYRKGKPSSVMMTTVPPYWIYQVSRAESDVLLQKFLQNIDPGKAIYRLSWTKDGRLGAIRCVEVESRHTGAFAAPLSRMPCETLGRIGGYGLDAVFTEERVRESLGEPNWPAGSTKLRPDGWKILRYGGPAGNVLILGLTRGEIRGITLSRPDLMEAQ